MLENNFANLLLLDDISVSFDGFKAIDQLSLTIAPGELRCIIGPNGAGKTTLMDIITGKTRPDSGRVLFKNTINLLELSEDQIANAGVGRKFQKPTVFENLSVFDNLDIAAKDRKTVLHKLKQKPTSERVEKINDILNIIGLYDAISDVAGELSHGQKQWLEIGMLLIQDGELLLIDEPVAGMTHQEINQTAKLLLKLRESHTVVVVEHDMEFIRSLDSRVTVLHQGSVLTEGSMQHVQNHPRVLQVYLS